MLTLKRTSVCSNCEYFHYNGAWAPEYTEYKCKKSEEYIQLPYKRISPNCPLRSNSFGVDDINALISAVNLLIEEGFNEKTVDPKARVVCKFIDNLTLEELDQLMHSKHFLIKSAIKTKVGIEKEKSKQKMLV